MQEPAQPLMGTKIMDRWFGVRLLEAVIVSHSFKGGASAVKLPAVCLTFCFIIYHEQNAYRLQIS